MKRSSKKSENIEAEWSQFMAEARRLLALSPDEMSPEQLERLEAIGDALIHLVGHAESLGRHLRTDTDRGVLKLLRHRRVSSGNELTDQERGQLRERILSGLQAAHLRVKEARVPPYEKSMDSPRVASAELLREMEMAHCALVVPELAIAAGAGLELWDLECTTTVDLPADVVHGRHVALRVSGDSMEPLIHSGDLLLVRLDCRATAGTVVVARDPEHGYVVKEVSRLTSDEIELRSLNPVYPVLRVPIGAGTVLGTVVLRWPAK